MIYPIAVRGIMAMKNDSFYAMDFLYGKREREGEVVRRRRKKERERESGRVRKEERGRVREVGRRSLNAF